VGHGAGAYGEPVLNATGSPSPTEPDALRRELTSLLDRRRQRTLALIAPLEDRELHEQFARFMSPLVWDVGHVGNFEELWLLRQLDGRDPTDPDLDRVYNPFENPRWTRGALPVLDRAAAVAYLAGVRAEVVDVLQRLELAPDHELLADGFVYRMIASHEAQHQETMLQALGLRDDLMPYPLPAPPNEPTRKVDDEDRVLVPGGPARIGTDDRTWAYDNEHPSHVVDVPAFALDRFPVTNRRYDAFIEDGGYARADLWSERGRRWLDQHGHRRPQGWVPGDGGWGVRRFGKLLALDPREPVQHVTFFEADAFARWSGGRLPTEVEWEKAAAWDAAAGRARRHPWGDEPPTPRRANVGLVRPGPAPVGGYPDGASAYGVEQLVGDVYEWTSSPFQGYPGFTPFPYPEYSEVFFGGDYRVLRGASWALAASLARCTYRNWDHPYRRQIFAGIRVAYDVASGGS